MYLGSVGSERHIEKYMQLYQVVLRDSPHSKFVCSYNEANVSKMV
jgi:hypothetical protein